MPRLLPDGQRNGVRLERLKEKLGNRSNASSEVEFYDACGWLVGDEGDGVRQILRMGGLTRFDCALGSHALMRRAFSVALYHALQRQAFGKNLVEQPMMRQLLGQMALRLEGQTAFLFRLARAWDRRDDARESAWARLFTPAAKFAICKAGIPFVAEAMEVLGGIGYCEESELPRLYREMPRAGDGLQATSRTAAGFSGRGHGFTALPAVNTFQTHLERRERHINAMLAEARQDQLMHLMAQRHAVPHLRGKNT